MKKIILLTCLLTLVAGVVLAQTQDTKNESAGSSVYKRIPTLGKLVGKGNLAPAFTSQTQFWGKKIGLKPLAKDLAMIRVNGKLTGLEGVAGVPGYVQENDISSGKGSIIDALIKIFQPMIDLLD